jgi:sialic acid synthase SpsE
LDFIEYIVQKEKPVIFSTGMSTIKEIRKTLDLLCTYSNEIVMMQCTSLYPPGHNQINLNVFDTYKKIIRKYRKNKIELGFSDHSCDNYACMGAVAKGAKYIEKHFTLNKKDKGPDHAISADIKDFNKLVRDIRIMERCCGDSTKKVYDEELPVISMARHSLVLLNSVQAGQKLTVKNLGTKRPGDGIPASEFYNFLGRKVSKSLKKNTLLTPDDVF